MLDACAKSYRASKVIECPQVQFCWGSTIRVHKIGPFRQMDPVHKGGSTLSTYPGVMDYFRTLVDNTFLKALEVLSLPSRA